MKNYFRHSTSERSRANIIKLRRRHGAAGYGIYLMILERLAEDPAHVAELDYDILAFDFHEDVELIRSVVEDFDLFEIDLEADTFAHEEITRQFTPKPKRETKPLDDFIDQLSADTYRLNALATPNYTTADRIRAILRTSFRRKILASHARIPDPDTLTSLLQAHLSDCLRT